MNSKYMLTKYEKPYKKLFLCLFLIFAITPKGALAGERIQPLTLDHAIKTAIARNPSIVATEDEKDASHAALKATKGRLLPRLDAYSSYTRFSDPIPVIPIKSFGGSPPHFSRDVYAMGVRGTFTLFQGGMLKADVKAAASTSAELNQQLARAQQILVAQVTDVFNYIIYLKTYLQAQNETLNALKKTRHDAALRLKLGKVAPLDLMEIDTQVTSQEQQIVATIQALHRSKQRLSMLMGLEPSDDFQIKGRLKNIVFAPQPLSTLTTLMATRPDLMKAQKQVERAQAEFQKAKGLKLPSIDLVGDYGRRAGTGLEGDEEVWSAGINLTLNIFNGGSTAARIAEAHAKELAARNRFMALRLQAKTEVLSALSALKEAEARLILATKSQETAQEAFRIEKLRYENGAATVTELLKAQAAWQDSRAQFIKALFDKMSAITAIRLSTGTILPTRS